MFVGAMGREIATGKNDGDAERLQARNGGVYLAICQLYVQQGDIGGKGWVVERNLKLGKTGADAHDLGAVGFYLRGQFNGQHIFILTD